MLCLNANPMVQLWKPAASREGHRPHFVCAGGRDQPSAEHPVCGHREPHKFRKTFATLHHGSGVSARTLQAWKVEQPHSPELDC
jgi:hypothetical protein